MMSLANVETSKLFSFHGLKCWKQFWKNTTSEMHCLLSYERQGCDVGSKVWHTKKTYIKKTKASCDMPHLGKKEKNFSSTKNVVTRNLK